jgi:predicted nucleic acid-binding Zn ribbon protein
MKKCKNENCEKIIPDKQKYCSYTCRNIFVNKNLRDYTKVKNTFFNFFEKKYYENPIFCLKCNGIIPYKKKRNKYCSHSCASSISNTKRQRKPVSEDFRRKISFLVKEKAKERLKEYCCKNCNISIFSFRKRIFCSNVCRIQFNKKNTDAFQQYKQKCLFTFKLNDYSEEFDFDLIKKYGWYKPKNRGNNINGVSRDHKLSIKEGFNKNIDPKIISHPANCELLIHSKNIAKNKNSSISLEELLIAIEKWNVKYKDNTQLWVK